MPTLPRMVCLLAWLWAFLFPTQVYTLSISVTMFLAPLQDWQEIILYSTDQKKSFLMESELYHYRNILLSSAA